MQPVPPEEMDLRRASLAVDNPLVAVYLVRAVRPLIENARSLVWGRPTNPELEKGGVAAARIGGRLSLVRGRPYRASMAEGRAARIEGGDVCAGARLQPHATGERVSLRAGTDGQEGANYRL